MEHQSRLQLWKRLARQHLGQAGTRRVEQLMCDLLAVDCGLKPSLLLDFGVPEIASVHRFLTALTKSGLLQNYLQTVTVDSDVLIVNAASFLSAETRSGALAPSCQTPIFVDISASLSNPCTIPADSSALGATRNSFLDLLNQMKGSCSEACAVEGSLTLKLEDSECCDKNINPSTLFGLFLGYPFVYYYDLSLQSEDNCLCMVPLVNFVLKGTVLNEKGFSSQAPQSRVHTIFSFSVPEMLIADAALEHIEGWLKDRINTKGWSLYFGELKLQKSVFVHPKVCL